MTDEPSPPPQQQQQQGAARAFAALSSNPIVRSITPAEFFNVRQEVQPKADDGTLFIMTMCSVLPWFVAFVALLTLGARDTHTVTAIKTSDITHSSGLKTEWNCQMISKVTEDVSISANETFSLYSVLESQDECLSNLHDTFNCGEALVDTDGSVATTEFTADTICNFIGRGN